MKIISNCTRNNGVVEKIKSLQKLKSSQEIQINKLVDLMLDGTIDKDIYAAKKEKLDRKLEKINKEINQYELLSEDDDKIEEGINKIKATISSNKILDGFDQEVFDALVDYIIIGGYDENGKIEENMIRFICKSKFNETNRDDLKSDIIIANNNLSKEDSIFINVFDFNSNQEYYVFYKDENGKQHKMLKKYIRVRLEVEK